MNPTNLLGIRYNLGHSYLAAVNMWKDEPGTEQERYVEKALQDYARELLKWADRERISGRNTLRVEYVREILSIEGVWERITKKANSITVPEIVKKGGPPAISGLIGLLVGPLGPLGIKLGFVIYRLLPPRSEPEDIELRTYKVSAAKTVIELDLPPKTQDDSSAPEGHK
jgi:hypothetical protein